MNTVSNNQELSRPLMKFVGHASGKKSNGPLPVYLKHTEPLTNDYGPRHTTTIFAPEVPLCSDKRSNLYKLDITLSLLLWYHYLTALTEWKNEVNVHFVTSKSTTCIALSSIRKKQSETGGIKFDKLLNSSKLIHMT